MKERYLKDLRLLLDNYNMSADEKDDIINDYNEMYDNWTEHGMNDDEVETKLGKPDSIIGELTEGYRRKGEHSSHGSSSTSTSSGVRNKIIALSPFVAVIIFFVLGFVFDGWAYSWVSFLLIPITAIVFSMAGKESHMLTALSPFIAVIAYGIIGFFYDLWHPGWVVFLIIPVIAILTEARSMKPLELATALSPFVAVSVYFLYFGPNDLWVPGWVVFLIIPAIGVLNEKSFLKIIIWEVLIIGGAAAYIYIGEVYDAYDYALLSFVPLALYGLMNSDTNFFEMPRRYRLVVLATIVAYVALGLLSNIVGINLWGVAWLVFLVIPVYAILTEVNGSEKIIAIMPFISVTIFFTLGFFFGWWAYSWLAFLLIPMVAIIKEA